MAKTNPAHAERWAVEAENLLMKTLMFGTFIVYNTGLLLLFWRSYIGRLVGREIP